MPKVEWELLIVSNGILMTLTTKLARNGRIGVDDHRAVLLERVLAPPPTSRVIPS